QQAGDVVARRVDGAVGRHAGRLVDDEVGARDEAAVGGAVARGELEAVEADQVGDPIAVEVADREAVRRHVDGRYAGQLGVVAGRGAADAARQAAPAVGAGPVAGRADVAAGVRAVGRAAQAAEDRAGGAVAVLAPLGLDHAVAALARRRRRQ